MTDTSNPAGVGASAMLAVDILRELARKDVETAAAYRGQDGADAIMGDYMAHAKALRYAANRLCSFEALASAPAPSHEHPIRDRGEPKPIGYARSVDVDPAERPFEGRTSFWCHERQNAYYSVPVYLAALPPARVEEGPRVKPLAWTKSADGDLSRAETIIDTYRVWTHFEADGRWFWSLSGVTDGYARDEAEAKAAAQQDYEARIRGALE